ELAGPGGRTGGRRSARALAEGPDARSRLGDARGLSHPDRRAADDHDADRHPPAPRLPGDAVRGLHGFGADPHRGPGDQRDPARRRGAAGHRHLQRSSAAPPAQRRAMSTADPLDPRRCTMTVATEHEVYYDPYDIGINADPYPTFRRLRDEAPIYYNERYDFWALSRHADVEQALVDWQTFSSSRADILEVVQSNMNRLCGIILWEDPPVHGKYRGLLSRVFTPRRMNALEEQVRAYCVSCLDPLVGTDRFDFVRDLGAEMPMRVIGMLLGIPESDQPAIRDHADKTLRTKAGEPMAVSERSMITGSMFADYIDWRAEHPSDDLMTALLTAEFEDETGTVRKLTRPEVLLYTEVVAGAGNETTGRLIGWLGEVLGEHPDQRREIVEDRALIANVIDETLRFEPTGPHVARDVARDV